MFDKLISLNKSELDTKLGEVIPKHKLKDMADVGKRKEFEQNGYKVMVDRTRSETIVIFLSDGENTYFYA